MNNSNFVSLRKLQQIAFGTALTNGLFPPSRARIAQMYYDCGYAAQPIVSYCAAGTLWVDKYYVAYQIGNGDIHYTYISGRHMMEEICSYRMASATRGIVVRLPTDILRCFHVARRKMRQTGLQYWIAAPWSGKVSPGKKVNRLNTGMGYNGIMG